MLQWVNNLTLRMLGKFLSRRLCETVYLSPEDSILCETSKFWFLGKLRNKKNIKTSSAEFVQSVVKVK